ncbi:MAG: GDYXXLXY domain-containing protein [Chloroflexi bacterium]|nr:GDYXXLXY domain-containing protein [Chloroflexota bacterium]
MKLRYTVMFIVALSIIVLVNGLIIQKERVISHGQTIFLELAPVDPRSLIQGDYMRLGYDLAQDVHDYDPPADGYLVLRVDKRNVASLVRIHDPQTPLADGELLLRYRVRDWNVRVGVESFFFQEGHAEYYDTARYGEFRVSESGEGVLVGLRGPDLEPLGPADEESDK